MRLRAECYTGRKGEERPLRFWFDERVRVVSEILEQWHRLDDAFFRVWAELALFISCGIAPLLRMASGALLLWGIRKPDRLSPSFWRPLPSCGQLIEKLREMPSMVCPVQPKPQHTLQSQPRDDGSESCVRSRRL